MSDKGKETNDDELVGLFASDENKLAVSKQIDEGVGEDGSDDDDDDDEDQPARKRRRMELGEEKKKSKKEEKEKKKEGAARFLDEAAEGGEDSVCPRSFVQGVEPAHTVAALLSLSLMPLSENGDVCEGLAPIDVTASCARLYNDMILKFGRLALVLGSPGCGKTSLARRFSAYVLMKGLTPIRIEAGHPLKYPERYFTGLMTAKNTVFIIDEAHTFYEKAPVDLKGDVVPDPHDPQTAATFNTMFIKNRPYYVACFTTTTQCEFASTPEELARYKYWYYGPTVDRGMTRVYFSNFLMKAAEYGGWSCDEKHRTRIVTSIVDYAGGSINVSLAVLHWVVEHNGHFPFVMDLLTSVGAPRVVVNGNADWTDGTGPDKHWFAKRLLAEGTFTIGKQLTDTQKGLLRAGYLAPLRPLDDDKPLIRYTQNDETKVTWAHSWQVDHAMSKCGLVLQREPVYADPAPQTRSPFDLLIYILPFFAVEQLLGTRIAGHSTETGSNASGTEHNFQGALQGALSRAVPQFGCVREYLVRDGNKSGRIDFVVRPDVSGKTWAIELLVDGTSGTIAEHVGRFDKDKGSYKGASITDHVVVDCKTESVTEADADSLSKLVVTICPHRTRGWDVITVYDPMAQMGGCRSFNVPRDCVPRFIDRNTLRAAVKVVCEDQTAAGSQVAIPIGGGGGRRGGGGRGGDRDRPRFDDRRRDDRDRRDDGDRFDDRFDDRRPRDDYRRDDRDRFDDRRPRDDYHRDDRGDRDRFDDRRSRDDRPLRDDGDRAPHGDDRRRDDRMSGARRDRSPAGGDRHERI